MRKFIRFFEFNFYHRFKIIDSCLDAEKSGLKFESNVHGDPINWYNCRSFWSDKYGFRYRCQELYKEKEIVELSENFKLK